MLNGKQISWMVAILASFLSVFGFYWFIVIVLALLSFIIGALTILYLQHGDLDKFLDNGLFENPLQERRSLGLNLVSDNKPIMLISPNIKIQTESKKLKNLTDTNRKKSFLDSGIDLLFKKHPKPIKPSGRIPSSPNRGTNSTATAITAHHDDFSSNSNSLKNSPYHRNEKFLGNDVSPHGGSNRPHKSASTSLLSASSSDDKSWNPFENIKIYTEKKRSAREHERLTTVDGKHANISFGEECSGSFLFNTSNESIAEQQATNKPPQKSKTILSGNKQIDQLLHLIIDYILRDFIDSWYTALTDNTEFNETLVRKCIEDFLTNICTRTKSQSGQWLPLLTTNIVEDIATHSKLYRMATESIAAEKREREKVIDERHLSPQRKSKKNQQHKRNKSDTELWFANNPTAQKNIANSKFYAVPASNEQAYTDPEYKLTEEFFNNCDLYKNECLDELALEKYLTHLTETILYFTLPKEEFSCLPLRTFLATLISSVVLKPVCQMLSDPDFINLQIARVFSKETPPGEYLIKMIRECSDLSELRACRQLITKEMDRKYRNSNTTKPDPELTSLLYSQQLIDKRISLLQNNITAVDSGRFMEREKPSPKLPILSLDYILNNELAISYYLDYLSIDCLQKYVIFYVMAQEWKQFTIETIGGKTKMSKEEAIKVVREKAWNLYNEYLITKQKQNLLDINPGLVETLAFKLNDATIMPDYSWFESISKYIYEKLKNEDIFLTNFYKSLPYKKLILELPDISNDYDSETSSNSEFSMGHGGGRDMGSDTNDDDDDDLVDDDHMGINFKISAPPNESHINSDLISTGFDLSVLPLYNKHSRSHSDCTGILQNMSDTKPTTITAFKIREHDPRSVYDTVDAKHLPIESQHNPRQSHRDEKSNGGGDFRLETKQKITANIIDTAINCEGQYAVYAIQVYVIELDQQKSWHIYRRYSKFLELKKQLTKKFADISKIPFPAKKAFQNTQRDVLEHRMSILRTFLAEICLRAETNDEILHIVRDFLEQDTNDKQHGGVVIRTLGTIVNPFKSGIRTIRNIPDNFFGGLSKLILGRSQIRESSFLQVPNVNQLEQKSSEYPALTSALKLLDEVFDLQSRSQWLRRGIINRLLGAPWVSHTANKKIVQTAKTMIELDKIEAILEAVLNALWPGGKQQRQPPEREDNTKLRTRMAAKIALFALAADDLKHVVGSETTRSGLLNFFQMLQNRKLNMRLVLILLNHILTVLYRMDNLTKHI